mgnify:CR=1 FL=1
MITIKRISYLIEGTFGVLLEDNVPFSLTAELPWLANLPKKSCIPCGTYICKRAHSPKFGDTFEITKVPNRSNILFHKGNVPKKDSKGCILIGERFEMIGTNVAVVASGEGFKEFLDRLSKVNNCFFLEIKDCR